MGANDGVDAHLGEEAGEHRRDWGRCRWIGVREPSRKREDGGLDGETDEEHDLKDQLDARVKLRQAQGQLGEVHSAGCRVGEADGDEEHHRGDERDHHVHGAGTHPLLRATHGDEHEGGGQQQLESHVDVEKVSGQERVGHSAGQEEECRVVDGRGRALIAIRHSLEYRVEQNQKRDGNRSDQHEGGEAIRHQHDAHRGRPAAHIQNDRAVQRSDEECDGGGQHGAQHADRGGKLQEAELLGGEKEKDSGAQHGEHHGQGKEGAKIHRCLHRFHRGIRQPFQRDRPDPQAS